MSQPGVVDFQSTYLPGEVMEKTPNPSPDQRKRRPMASERFGRTLVKSKFSPSPPTTSGDHGLFLISLTHHELSGRASQCYCTILYKLVVYGVLQS